jgi:hypothetical protein
LIHIIAALPICPRVTPETPDLALTALKDLSQLYDNNLPKWY